MRSSLSSGGMLHAVSVLVTVSLLALAKACCTDPEFEVPTLVKPSQLPTCIANPDLQCCQQVRSADCVFLVLCTASCLAISAEQIIWHDNIHDGMIYLWRIVYQHFLETVLNWLQLGCPRTYATDLTNLLRGEIGSAL